MQTSVIIVGVLALWVGFAQGKPGHFFYGYPPSSQTTVLRDALGNQATAYSYQDGHSSSVAVSRNDVSKHLTYVPVPVAAPVLHQHVEPIVYEQPALVAGPAYHYSNHLPAAHYGGYYNYL
ncbi:uncharacterized protein LOC110849413 [Folsomia candida]|uniref:Cuticle protein 6 n=1 Tax=Folsomia candida TaxID=158441 RepID=A0A226EET9_FOLCA|nr:uncharacterized protein LOC110849413 [Folsomia candida]OXA55587.1 hypothetical protein Fcan01_09241 [Folsomia candida]